MMTEKIKLTSDELRLISLFQSITSATARDCIVDASKKGVVVGREGRNAEKARLLAKRYFQISNVLIVSEDQSPMHRNQVNM